MSSATATDLTRCSVIELVNGIHACEQELARRSPDALLAARQRLLRDLEVADAERVIIGRALELRQLCDRITAAVDDHPAALDNNALADELGVERVDAADACEWLVGHDRLQMHEDGTYLRSVASAAREVTAA